MTNFDDDAALGEAIRRYYVLLRMTFDTNIYKLYETPTSQIYKFETVQSTRIPPSQAQQAQKATAELECKKCGSRMRIQANFEPTVPLDPGYIPFPTDNKLQCVGCGVELDVTQLRQQLEAQNKRKVLTPQA